MIPDEKSHRLRRVHNEKHAIQMAYYLFIFRRFWVKEPRHSEKEIAKIRYTFIETCVLYPNDVLGT